MGGLSDRTIQSFLGGGGGAFGGNRICTSRVVLHAEAPWFIVPYRVRCKKTDHSK